MNWLEHPSNFWELTIPGFMTPYRDRCMAGLCEIGSVMESQICVYISLRGYHMLLGR